MSENSLTLPVDVSHRVLANDLVLPAPVVLDIVVLNGGYDLRKDPP